MEFIEKKLLFIYYQLLDIPEKETEILITVIKENSFTLLEDSQGRC